MSTDRYTGKYAHNKMGMPCILGQDGNLYQPNSDTDWDNLVDAEEAGKGVTFLPALDCALDRFGDQVRHAMAVRVAE